jgi:hypothetical protein
VLRPQGLFAFQTSDPLSGEEENVFEEIKTCLKPLDLSQSDETILASIATETVLPTEIPFQFSPNSLAP